MRVAGPLLPLLLLTGCAHFEPRSPILVKEDVLATEKVEVPMEGSIANFSTQGESLVVEVNRRCDVWQKSTIEQTTARTYENKTPGLDVALGAGALGLGAGGIILLVDTAGQSGGNQATIGVGTTLLLAGALMGGAAVIDLLRARRVELDKAVVQTEGHRIAQSVACARAPIADAEVEVRVGRIGYLAGSTDATGHITIPLSSAIGPEVKLPLRAATAKVVVGGRIIGDLGLHSMAVRREEQAWRALNLQQCAEPLAVDACAPVVRYLEDYPDGPHAADAQRALSRAEPALLKLRDDTAWRRVQPSLGACLGKDATAADAIDVACGVLANYARDFPTGEHAREAERAVTTGRARVATLRAESAKRTAQKCTATCRAHCARASVTRFDDCFQGCLDAGCKSPE